MKFTKLFILMTLLALIASRSLEEDNNADQTIGWGRQRVAEAEDFVAEEKMAGGGNMILEMSEEEQHLGLGF